MDDRPNETRALNAQVWKREAWPFESLTPLKYGVILVDPPWRFANYSAKGEEKNPVAYYDCMDAGALRELPVGHLAAADCALLMWAYWAMMPLAFDLISAWGFTFKSGGAWAKQSATGKKWAFSTGYLFRGACEPFLLATIGKPEVGDRAVRNLIVAPVREHSRKPDEMHAALERLFPNAWRCELFARERRPGWDAWGNEASKFDVPSKVPA